MSEQMGLLTFEEACEAAITALTGLFSRVPSLSNDDLLVATSAAEQAGRMVDGLRGHLAGELDSRCTSYASDGGINFAQGCRTSAELISRQTGIGEREAVARVKRDQKLCVRFGFSGGEIRPDRPHIADAVGAGTIGTEAVDVILKAVQSAITNHAPDDHVDLMEKCLTGIAAGSIEPDDAATCDPSTFD
ncbi:MAG: hypothetical protein QM607_05520, partial [Microbacterium sp.]